MHGKLPMSVAMLSVTLLSSVVCSIGLRRGAEQLGDWRLKDCTLYVTLEPCPMCAGALLMSRLGRCVFAAADPDAGCCGSVYDLPADPLLRGQTRWEQAGPADECRGLLDRFFRSRRPEGGTK